MNNISYIDVPFKKISNYDESTDAIVPDMFSDIKNIVLVTAKAFVKDTSMQNDRVVISGEIKCEVCYMPEDSENLEKMPITMSFAHIEDIKGENPLIFSNCKINKVEARIINPRKISILANMCVETSTYKKKEIKVAHFEDESLEILAKTKEISMIDSVNINEFVITDNFEIQSSLNEECKHFGITPFVNVTDMKILKNKLMVRGTIDFKGANILENNITTFKESVPFSQILDINVTDDSLVSQAFISLKSFDIESISAYEYSFSLAVKMCLTQKRVHKINTIKDMYSTQNELIITKNEYKLKDVFDNNFENMEFFANVECNQIVDNVAFVNFNPYMTKNADNTNNLCGYISGAYKSEDKLVDFSADVTLKSNIKENYSNFLSTNITHNSNNGLEFKINIEAFKESEKIVDLITIENIEKGEAKPMQNDAIILKYISTETPIFNIAKEYNTKASDIIMSNNLEENAKTIKDKMILIPII